MALFQHIKYWWKVFNFPSRYLNFKNFNFRIPIVDFDQKILKGNLIGAFTNGLDSTVEIEQFEIDLNWE